MVKIANIRDVARIQILSKQIKRQIKEMKSRVNGVVYGQTQELRLLKLVRRLEAGESTLNDNPDWIQCIHDLKLMYSFRKLVPSVVS
ncbi:hypothetical protein [Paenibacillus agricola]|uniref:Uncharacterized protein n=1 Tax=Paenibacillus agricola TaxID=2716264 RepID=A0ABX0JKW0_9BACL|nr:hypothetical protein [Paenibacillus agricola]NHN35578.1 hypothetical protein [Paenibacillus agricola]